MADQQGAAGPTGPIGIRGELCKVERMPRWGRVQGNAWDRASRFIYRIDDLDTLRRETKRTAARMNLPLWDFGSYVIRRWYNFHTHQVVLDVILAHTRTRPEPDPYHHTVDFYLDDEGFDLKLTGLPRGFGRDLAYARAHPVELAHWLYANQSKQGRFHAANRLFVVLRDTVDPARTWELRRDFERLEQVLHAFLDRPDLARVAFNDRQGNQRKPLAGVVFCTREM